MGSSAWIPVIVAALGFAIGANLGGLWPGVIAGVAGACWGKGIVRFGDLKDGTAEFGWVDGIASVVTVLVCMTLLLQADGEAALPLLVFMLFLWFLPFGAVVLLLSPFLRKRRHYRHYEPPPRREPEQPVHVHVVRRTLWFGRKRG